MAVYPPRAFTNRVGQVVTVRSVAHEDANNLYALTQALYEEPHWSTSEANELVSFDEFVQKFERLNADSCGLSLVAEIESDLVGGLGFQNDPHRRLAHRGKFGMVVRKQSRGHGVGRALLESLVEWASEHATIEKLKLDVFSTNLPAIRLYESVGFREEGRLPNEIRLGDNDYIDVIEMYRFVAPCKFGSR